MSKNKLQPVRGTHDLMPEVLARHRFVADTARGVASRYGYREIATPVFEFSEVFHRTLGDTSDVVSKETYSFEDRGGESLTLRPEFTAGVVRAFLSNGLTQDLPQKFFYHGPAFRYERPQKGRMRQFHQIGVECLGVAESMGDVETIALAWQILSALGLSDRITLRLNSLGDAASRTAYRRALVEHFSSQRDRLSEDSRLRLEKNPLRILDSKDEGDKVLNAAAPNMKDFFTAEAKEFFHHVMEGLAALGIPYSVTPHLVRGLDYYSHTVFEFTCDDLGAQTTVLAGGRYDGLVEMMGGPSTPGIGFAAGVERLVELVDFARHPLVPKAERPIVIVPIGDAAERQALVLAQTLRAEGQMIELDARGSMGKRMKRADKLQARAAVILGDAELEKGVVMLKDLDSGEQTDVSFANLSGALASFAEA